MQLPSASVDLHVNDQAIESGKIEIPQGADTDVTPLEGFKSLTKLDSSLRLKMGNPALCYNNSSCHSDCVVRAHACADTEGSPVLIAGACCCCLSSCSTLLNTTLGLCCCGDSVSSCCCLLMLLHAQSPKSSQYA